MTKIMKNEIADCFKFTPSSLFYKEVGKSIKFSKWFFKENKILGKNNMVLVK